MTPTEEETTEDCPVYCDDREGHEYRQEHPGIKALERHCKKTCKRKKKVVDKGRTICYIMALGIAIGTDGAIACKWRWEAGDVIDRGEVLVNKDMVERALKSTRRT